MYREPGEVVVHDDPLFVEPGKGLRGIWVGRATPDDVLRVFGDDADVARYSSGEIFQIGYATTPARPKQFGFEFSLLDQIYVAATNSDLFTTGGLRYGSPREEIVRVLGEPSETIPGETLQALRYLSLGIEVTVSLEHATLSSFVIFRARR